MKNILLLLICLSINFQVFATPYYDPDYKTEIYDGSYSENLKKKLTEDFIKKYRDKDNPNKFNAPQGAYKDEVLKPYFNSLNEKKVVGYYSPNKTVYNITHKDINDYLYYIKIHHYEMNVDGSLNVNYTEYSDQGANYATEQTTYDLLLENIKKFATIFKYQGYGRKKIDYVNADNEELICKYYVDDNLIKQNKLKNRPATTIKLPTVSLGRLKIAKKDIPYTPVAESPFKLNYWAGARNACLKQGMRLPDAEEFENIYKNKSILKISFTGKNYWVSDEVSPCFATAQSLEKIAVGTGQNIKMSGNFTYDEKKYLDKKNLKFVYYKETYFDIYTFTVKKTAKNISVRCVR